MKDKYSIEAVASQMKAVYEWILGNFTRPNFVFIKQIDAGLLEYFVNE